MGITRQELFKSLGVVKTGPQLDEWTEKAYLLEEDRSWHEQYLSISFPASKYPVDDGACARQALYKLMNFPEATPITPKGMGVMEAGKAVEEQIVERWAKMGIMLGPEYPMQLRIEEETLWLKGYIDAALNLKPEWPYVLPVEIKSKKNNVIEYMKVGGQSYDQAHYNQLQAYLYYCIKNHYELGWDKLGLQPAVGGIIYYVSREDPRNTFEFYVEADGFAMAEANGKLAAWKEMYLNDRLPARPDDWQWSKGACQWCPFKKFICKPDVKDGIVKLSESNGVAFAEEHFGKYNAENTKRRVIEKWTQRQLELF